MGDTTVWSLDTTGSLRTNSINSISGTGVTFSDTIIATNGIQFSDGLQTQAYTGGASVWDGIATSDLVLSTFDMTTTHTWGSLSFRGGGSAAEKKREYGGTPRK